MAALALTSQMVYNILPAESKKVVDALRPNLLSLYQRKHPKVSPYNTANYPNEYKIVIGCNGINLIIFAVKHNQFGEYAVIQEIRLL